MTNYKKPFKLAALCIPVLLAVASGVYLSKPGAPQGAPQTPVQDSGSENSVPSPEPTASAQADVLPTTPPTAVQPSAPAQAAGARVLAYRFKGTVQGQPLSRLAPAATEGPEKGRVMEMERLSVADLGNWTAGQTVRLATPDGELSGLVNLVQPDGKGWVRVGGSIQGQAGSFTLAAGPASSGGLLMLPKTGKAFEVVTEQDGRVLLVERRLADKRCYTGEVAAMRPLKQATIAAAGSVEVPVLASRPGAPAVVYMDFDGETVTDPAWNNGVTIVAAAPGATSAEITEIFNRVVEDFAPFNVNITTVKSYYEAAAPNRRTRCIITPTNTAAPGAGGVAYVGAFNTAGRFFSDDLPCWVFNGGVIGASEAISHEVGHTLGLLHDGRTSPSEGYYTGHGGDQSVPTSWAPIMGVGYYRSVSQWSKGEYLAANNKEDDLAIITQAANGITYVPTVGGATAANPVPLKVNGSAIGQKGLITKAGNPDFFQFTLATAGSISVTASPGAVLPDLVTAPTGSISPSLDVSLQLRKDGVVVTSVNPTETLGGTLSVSNLAAGNYTLVVSGTAKGIVTGTGYSSYGSLGTYALTGSIAGISGAPAITSSAQLFVNVGSPVSYQVSATNSPTSFAVTPALPGGLALNATTGSISGTPTTAGAYTLALTATNGSGTSASFPLALTVSPAVLRLADALNLSGYSITTGTAGGWVAVNAGSLSVSPSDPSFASSGKIANGAVSSMSISVVGPKKLSFQWKVSSEAMKDKLSLIMDGSVLDSISGETSWAARTLNIPAGTHKIEWSYSKDASMTAGSDAAFVDAVAVTAPDPLSLSGNLNFGKVAIGSSGTSNLTITNASSEAISVTGITYSQGFSGNFTGTIAAGTSRVVSVSFNPTAETVYSGDVTVGSSVGNVTLQASGEGIFGVMPLVSNGTLSSLAALSQSSRVYKISVPTGSTSLKVNTFGGTGDVDIYLKKGVPPSPTDIDFLSEADGNVESINVANPSSGDWYILLFGYLDYSGVSLNATVTAPPSSLLVSVASAGNGTVTGGGSYAANSTAVVTAKPASGYLFEKWVEGGSIQSTSASYSFTVTKVRSLVASFTNFVSLTSNLAVNNQSGAVGSQKLYKITVPLNTALLSVATSGGTGDVDLYLKRGSAPSVTAFDYRSSKVGNAESLSVVNPVAGEWYVMVRAFKAYTKVSLKAVVTPKTAAKIASPDSDNATALRNMAGGYDGLLGDGATRLLGRMEIRLMTGGAFSAKALLDGLPYSFTGKLDAEGRWKGAIKVNINVDGVVKAVPMPVGLAADLQGQLIIKGSVGWDGIQYEVLAMRHTLGAPDQAGTYAVTLWPNPDETGLSLPTYDGSNGAGVITVKKDGSASLKGTLVDGTSVTAGGQLSTDGKWAMYSPLYNKTGAIGGWWIFEPWKTGQSVKGSLRWKRDANEDAPVEYRAGFNGLVTGQGAMLAP